MQIRVIGNYFPIPCRWVWEEFWKVQKTTCKEMVYNFPSFAPPPQGQLIREDAPCHGPLHFRVQRCTRSSHSGHSQVLQANHRYATCIPRVDHPQPSHPCISFLDRSRAYSNVNLWLLRLNTVVPRLSNAGL